MAIFKVIYSNFQISILKLQTFEPNDFLANLVLKLVYDMAGRSYKNTDSLATLLLSTEHKLGSGGAGA